MVFKDQWHVGGIKDGSLVILADNLETEGLGSILKIQVAMLGRDIVLDLRTFKAQRRIRDEVLLLGLIGDLWKKGSVDQAYIIT